MKDTSQNTANCVLTGVLFDIQIPFLIKKDSKIKDTFIHINIEVFFIGTLIFKRIV